MQSVDNINKLKTKLKADMKADMKADTSDKDENNNKLMLDSILDKKLVKFDNKLQMSMFFIAYKSIDTLYKELSEAANYTIPDEIIKRVVLETVPSLIREYNSNMRKRCRSKISNNTRGIDDTICLGRKINGTQCTRKKYNNNDFCKNHIKKLSNGRVDIPLEKPVNEVQNNIIVKVATAENNSQPLEKMQGIKELIKPLDNITPLKTSKRGRKSKIQFDPRQYDNEYITLWEDIVEGEKVLIDNANNIYTFDLEHPVYIGKKDVLAKLNIRKFIDSLAKKE